MNRHRDCFNQVLRLEKFRIITNKEISRITGFTESKLSRFLSGKQDLNTGEFFYLLESMPEDFQKSFWLRFYPQFTLQDLIADMDAIALANLISSISAQLPIKLAESEGSKKIEEELLSV